MKWVIPLMQRATVGVSPEKKSPTYELKTYTGYAFLSQAVVESHTEMSRKAQDLAQLYRASPDMANFPLSRLQSPM